MWLTKFVVSERRIKSASARSEWPDRHKVALNTTCRIQVFVMNDLLLCCVRTIVCADPPPKASPTQSLPQLSYTHIATSTYFSFPFICFIRIMTLFNLLIVFCLISQLVRPLCIHHVWIGFVTINRNQACFHWIKTMQLLIVS